MRPTILRCGCVSPACPGASRVPLRRPAGRHSGPVEYRGDDFWRVVLELILATREILVRLPTRRSCALLHARVLSHFLRTHAWLRCFRRSGIFRIEVETRVEDPAAVELKVIGGNGNELHFRLSSHEMSEANRAAIVPVNGAARDWMRRRSSFVAIPVYETLSGGFR